MKAVHAVAEDHFFLLLFSLASSCVFCRWFLYGFVQTWSASWCFLVY